MKCLAPLTILITLFGWSAPAGENGFDLDLERALAGYSIDGASRVPGWDGGLGRLEHHLREEQLAAQMGGLPGMQRNLAIGVGLRLGKGRTGLVGSLFSGGIPVQVVPMEDLPWPWLDEPENPTDLQDRVAAELAARLGAQRD